MTRVLFICMGNICRSPSAEGVFRRLLQQEGLEERIQIDSAGTHTYHAGHPPDRRSQQAALTRGVDISALRARLVEPEDFERFDWLVAMDYDNLAHLERVAPPHLRDKPKLLLSFAPEVAEEEVPDPYYGGPQGFEHVLDLLEAGSAGLLAAILSNARQ